MPLNIDWQQILLHAFNFIILAAGLTFLLFKPVKKFMAAREESYKKAAEEHRQKLDELESLEKERQAKIAALDGELAEREQKAVAAADAHSKRIVAEARDEAEKIISDGKKRAAVEREKYIAGAGDEITSLIVRSAEKLLAAEDSAACRFVAINNLADSDDPAATALIDSMVQKEGVLVLRNICSSRPMTALWQRCKEQMSYGMTFTNEKMAVIILSPKLPRQDFAIWLS